MAFRFSNLKLGFSVLFIFVFSVLVYCQIFSFNFNFNNSVFSGQNKGSLKGSCRPAKKVAFLKTHKCASTTVQNVILRKAYYTEANVALPQYANYLGKYQPFTRMDLLGTPWEKAGFEYDFHCLHGIWNYDTVTDILTKGGTNKKDPVFYFSILRDPVDLFVSLWDYTGLEKHYGMPLEEYVQSPYKDVPGHKLADRRIIRNTGRDQMLYDFGLSTRLVDDVKAVEAKIVDIEKTFDLILISEHFDESMIMLKDLLCWDYRDVSYVKLNSVDKSSKSHLSPTARAALAEWLKADYMLYNHFKKVFQRRLDSYGREVMERQVSVLRKANKWIKKTCVAEAEVDTKDLKDDFKVWGQHTLGYKLKNAEDEFCKMYVIGELAFIRDIREMQTERAMAELKRLNITFEDEGSKNNKSSSQLISPAQMRLPNGMPDIERLKKMYAHN